MLENYLFRPCVWYYAIGWQCQTNGCCTLSTALKTHLNASYCTQAQNIKAGLCLANCVSSAPKRKVISGHNNRATSACGQRVGAHWGPRSSSGEGSHIVTALFLRLPKPFHHKKACGTSPSALCCLVWPQIHKEWKTSGCWAPSESMQWHSTEQCLEGTYSNISE